MGPIINNLTYSAFWAILRVTGNRSRKERFLFINVWSVDLLVPLIRTVKRDQKQNLNVIKSLLKYTILYFERQIPACLQDA